MSSWASGEWRVAQVKKSMKNIQVIILCLVLTLLIIWSLVGSSEYDTQERDLSFIQFHFLGRNHNQLFQELEDPSFNNAESTENNSNLDGDITETNDMPEAPDDKSTESKSKPGAESSKAKTNPNSYEFLNITKLLGVEEPEEKKDPSKPYSLGPKVSNWDDQRANWLKKNPGFPNFVQRNKPRVLLVTGSSPKPCENPVGDHFLLKSMKNKIDYCRIHGIDIYYNMALLDAEMSGFWAKLPLIRKLLLSHPEVELLWWMDSDAMFTDMAFELPWERYKDANLVMHGFKEMVYDNKSWVGLNTGSFLIRNTQWALDLLDAWVPMGPEGKIRDEAGKFLARELSDRPVFEADDQSAFVYLLVTQREKWGDKVYLEKAYYLNGYWKVLVEKYEEMMENYHPGLGDDRWPFVTHFTGCKPCAKLGNYPVEECLIQMNRAFNFGDNQIMQMYGFRHKSLASRKVTRIRSETSNPLEIKDEFGLLHPSYKAVGVSS